MNKYLQNQIPLVVFSVLGFVSGLPFALVTTTLQAWLVTQQVSLQLIAGFSLVSLPYALKPVWAIGIDWLRTQLGVSMRTIYMIAVAMFTACMAGVSYHNNFEHVYLPILLLTGCFASATIDICVDAMRIVQVAEHIQGLVSAWFVIFYRIAFIISGGLALVIAEKIGWPALYWTMAQAAGVVGTVGYYLVGLLPKEQRIDTSTCIQTSFWLRVVQWLRSSYKNVCSTLGFVFAFKFHGIFLASLLQVYLISEAQISLSYIGYTYKTGGMLATFSGGIIAGILAKRTSIQSGVRLTVLAQIIATAILYYSYSNGLSSSPLWGITWLSMHKLIITLAMYMESFSLGIATTFITVLLTKNCDQGLAATQYAFFTAAIAWQRSLITPITAWIQSNYGWSGYFLLSLIFVPYLLLRNRVGFSSNIPKSILVTE